MRCVGHLTSRSFPTPPSLLHIYVYKEATPHPLGLGSRIASLERIFFLSHKGFGRAWFGPRVPGDPEMGPTWPQLEPSWSQLRPKLDPDWLK